MYLECEAASGVVFTLSDAVHQHFNPPVDAPLLRPVQNTLLQRQTQTAMVEKHSSVYFLYPVFDFLTVPGRM